MLKEEITGACFLSGPQSTHLRWLMEDGNRWDRLGNASRFKHMLLWNDILGGACAGMQIASRLAGGQTFIKICAYQMHCGADERINLGVEIIRFRQ